MIVAVPRGRDRSTFSLADLARYEDDSRSQDEAVRLSAESVRGARAWLAQMPQEPLAARTLASALATQGNVLSTVGQNRNARQSLQEGALLSEKLLKQNPSDDELGFSRARVGHWLSNVEGTLGEYETALAEELQAQSVLDGLLARHPENFRWR